MAVRERWKGTRPVGLATSECVDLLVPATVADARIQAVYLFGSRAAGEGHADSDVDFAIYTKSLLERLELLVESGDAK